MIPDFRYSYKTLHKYVYHVVCQNNEANKFTWGEGWFWIDSSMKYYSAGVRVQASPFKLDTLNLLSP